jgi:hypothetical protein
MKMKFWAKSKPRKSIFTRVWTYVILATVVGVVIAVRRGVFGG